MASSTGLDIELELRQQLSGIPAVESVRFAHNNGSVYVWVGMRGEDSPARHAVYAVEDKLSERYRDLLFDFHLVPLPEGRRLADFASSATQIFDRAAPA